MTSGAAIAMARPSKLEGRLLAVLDGKRNRRGLTRSLVLAGLVLTLGIAIPLACLRPRGPDAKSPDGGDAALKPNEHPNAAPAESAYRNETLNEELDFSFSGVVRGEGGKPIADAIVHADEAHEEHPPQLTATTGPDGSYRFEKLATGIWSIWAEKKGLTRTYPYEHVFVLPASWATQVDLVLFRPRKLVVRVKDETGAAVPDAQVIVAREFYENGDTPQGNIGTDLASARTDAAGEAIFTTLRPYSVCLVVTHPTYAVYVSDRLKVGGRPAEIVLSKGGAVFGRVEFEGKPLAGVTIKAACGALSHRNMGEGQSVTDAQGRFRVERLYLGPEEMGYWDSRVWVESTEWASDYYSCRLSPKQPQREIVIQAKRWTADFQPGNVGLPEPESAKTAQAQPAGNAEVSGVAYGSDDKPVSGVAVSLFRPSDFDAMESAATRYSATVHSDDQGRFAFSNVPAGTYIIEGPLFVTDNSHMEGMNAEQVTDKRRAPLLTPVRFTLADREKKSVDLRSGHSVISGKVLGISKEVVEVRLMLTSHDPDSLWGYVGNWVTVTDADLGTGRFEFPAIEKGIYDVVIEPRTREEMDPANDLVHTCVSTRERVTVDGLRPAELQVELGQGRIEGVLLTPQGGAVNDDLVRRGTVRSVQDPGLFVRTRQGWAFFHFVHFAWRV